MSLTSSSRSKFVLFLIRTNRFFKDWQAFFPLTYSVNSHTWKEMADGFDPCECMWSQDGAMQRLISLVRDAWALNTIINILKPLWILCSVIAKVFPVILHRQWMLHWWSELTCRTGSGKQWNDISSYLLAFAELCTLLLKASQQGIIR